MVDSMAAMVAVSSLSLKAFQIERSFANPLSCISFCTTSSSVDAELMKRKAPCMNPCGTLNSIVFFLQIVVIYAYFESSWFEILFICA